MVNEFRKFIEQSIKDKKLRLQELELQHQINTADYIARRDMLTEDIYEYEMQLSNKTTKK